jgi:hypothetical protein
MQSLHAGGSRSQTWFDLSLMVLSGGSVEVWARGVRVAADEPRVESKTGDLTITTSTPGSRVGVLSSVLWCVNQSFLSFQLLSYLV